MHFPVLLQEVLKYLNPQPNENFIDATFGEGGYAKVILEKTKPEGRLLGIDLDADLLELAKERYSEYKDRLILVNDNYKNLEKIAEEKKFKNISGIIFDLGFCTWHLEESKRGFSFRKEEPLEMTYNKKNYLTARKIINEWQGKEIERILKEYGEERYAKRIMEKIIENRKKKLIETTFDLVEIIKKAVPKKYLFQRIHFATRTFQALRIVVNKELENLKQVLPQILKILKKEGKIVIISFHSLEDRIVKNFLKEEAKVGKIEILTKKPIRALWQEIKINPSARSAKLRAAKKI